jgi:hypothetical protein
VLDSGSKDQTVSLALAAGARVFTRPFDNFANQRNYAQQKIPFIHPWVFHLDADERMTPELRLECGGAMFSRNVDGFHVAPKVLWDGKWIRHATGYPRPEPRFVRAPHFQFIAAGHTQREARQMRMGRLATSYVHDPSRGGPDEWLDRHRLHARVEAYQRLAKGESASLRLPGRFFMRFLKLYLLKRGFLDGREGLLYCWLFARYRMYRDEELRVL